MHSLRSEEPFGEHVYESDEEEIPEQSHDSDDDSEYEADNVYTHYKLSYMDPFKVNAAMEMSANGKQPKLINWPGGVIRLTDSIPLFVLNRLEGKKAFKRSVPLFKISDPETILDVLLRHTHWGIKLQLYCDPQHQDAEWAQRLRKRIKNFIFGKHDPLWSNDQIRAIYGDRSYKPRKPRHRCLRLLQVLQTVDGMFTQCYLVDITAGWNWCLYDQFVLGMINHLIGDEFIDGELATGFPYDQVTSAYATLKSHRGAMKGQLLNGKPAFIEGPGAHLFTAAADTVNRTSERIRKTMLMGILIQTRGCGTPPPLVVLQSKVKFLKTVSEPSEPLEMGQLTLIRLALKDLLEKIPDGPFTGLRTKAGIRVTTSACMENLRAEGGSSEYVRTIVREGTMGRPVPTRDLETGQIGPRQKLDEGSIGEYIFLRCMEEVLATPPETLREAHLVMVKEPGKARTVTKAHAALKVVLDLVNGICSYPLTRVESSASGMSKSNHGWNFFTDLYGQWKELAFKISQREVRNAGIRRTLESLEYQDLFIGFTDYSEATDKMDHKIAQIVSEMWMLKCGIPKLLRGIVHETCYKSRTIFFEGTGPLESIGNAAEEGKLRYVTLVKGVLMGDPLTKVVLHLMNMVTRRLGASTTDKSVVKLLPFTGETLFQQLMDTILVI